MPIKLNVGSEFDEAAARRTAREAEDYYKRQAAELKVKAKLEEKSARDASGEAQAILERNAAKLRVDAVLQEDAAREVMAKFNAELRAQRKPVIEVETKVDSDSVARAMGSIDNSVKSSAQVMQSFFERFMSDMKQMDIGARSFTPVLFAAAVPVLTTVAGVAASAAQSIWLLPAAAGAAGAAIGTLQLATLGFSDAMKDIRDVDKFAVALQSLAPNAQQAALSIQALLPAFDQLKAKTQDALFAGVGEQLNLLANQYLPQIQSMTTGIASAFNQAFSGVANQLMAPETQGAIQQFMTNTVTAFQQLAPAVAPLTKAFADIMAVGSGFMPDLARAATDAATAFSQFITQARQSGDLQRWLGEGLDTLKQLGGAAIEVAKAFMGLAPVGREILPDIVSLIKGMADAIPPIVNLIKVLGDNFLGLFGAVKLFDGAFGWVGTAVRDFGDLRNAISPIEGLLHRVEQAVRAVSAAIAALHGDLGPLADLLGFNLSTTSATDAAKAAADAAVAARSDPNSLFGPAPKRAAPAPSSGFFGSAVSPLPVTAGLAPVPSGGYSMLGGIGGTAGGTSFSSLTGGLGVGTAPPSAAASSGGGAAPAPTAAETAAAAAAASHVEDTHGVLVPNALQLQELIKRVFPAVTSIGGYRSPDGYNEHSSGEALDIMVGANRALGDQVNQFLLANADALGLQYDIWQQATWKPGGGYSPMADRGSPTENHMDHVHARVLPGAAKPFGRGIGMPSTAGSLGSSGRVGSGDAIPVYVTNMPSGGLGGGGGAGGSGTGALTGPGGTAGPTDLLGAFFNGLSSGGGWGGVAGGIGTNILGMASSAASPGAFAGLGASASASAMGPAAFAPPINPSGTNWDAIAQKESGGNWGINTGNGYYGGLQFTPETWSSYGGTGMPQDASREEQIRIAENVLKGQGPSAWPNTYSVGAPAPGFAAGGGVDDIPAMLTAGEHVLTREDVAALGGQGAVYAFRNALHRQGGGEIFPFPLADLGVLRDPRSIPGTNQYPSGPGPGLVGKPMQPPIPLPDYRENYAYAKPGIGNSIWIISDDGSEPGHLAGSRPGFRPKPKKPKRDPLDPFWGNRQGVQGLGFATGGAVIWPDQISQLIQADVGMSGDVYKAGMVTPPPGKADYDAQLATHSGKFNPAWGNLALGPGNINPGTKIDTTRASMGSEPAWKRWLGRVLYNLDIGGRNVPRAGFASGGAVGFRAGGAAGYQWDPKNAPSAKPPPAPPPPIVVNTGQGTGPLPGPPSGPSVGAAIGATIQGRAQGEGGWQPGKSAGGGGGGGLIGQAAGMFPGGQVAAQLATRAAEFGGQALAIGASGLMETFLPSGSTLGDPSKSWFGKLASGFGGARSSIPNTAGKIEPVAQQAPPGSPASGQGSGPPPGPAIGEVNFHSPVQDQQSMVRDINRQINAHGAGSGW